MRTEVAPFVGIASLRFPYRRRPNWNGGAAVYARRWFPSSSVQASRRWVPWTP